MPSAKYFQGDRSPIEAETEAIGYSNAWLHHKAHNKHHWEYWCDFDSKTGEVFPHKIPYKYVVEMICDWIAAGKTYSKEKWTENSPLEYYKKVRKGRYFHPNTELLILRFLYELKSGGLKKFHKMANPRNKYRIEEKNDYEWSTGERIDV